MLGEGEEDEGFDRFVGVVGVGASVVDETFPSAGCAVGVGFFAFGDEAVDGDSGMGLSGHEGKEVTLAFFGVWGGSVAVLEVGGFVDARTNGGIGGCNVYGGIPGVVSDDVCSTDSVGVGAVDVARVG